MNRKISVGMAVSIVILAMTVTFSITMLVAMRLFDSTVSSVKEKESMYNKIAEVDRYVRSNDYYPIDETTLYDRLTAGYLLGTGDKYARYFSATAYTELMNTQNGTLIGIGVELAVDQSGYAKVIKVYDESPAKEAGIQVGNYITAVDGTDVKSMSSVDAIQTRLRGESGTTVNVTWLDSEAAEHTADLTHSGYSSTTVDYQMVQGNVGYIRIRQFDSTTPSELDYAIRSLSANGAGSLVFDLRDNGGGLLDDAIQCIDLIAPEGTLAFAEDKNGTRTLLGTSTINLIIALAISCATNYARIVRASVMTVRDLEYVESSYAMGLPTWKIILRHILPNCLSPIIVQTTLLIGTTIISASSLSFLGIGVPAPAPEWGALLSGGRGHIRDASYICVIPGLAIMFTVLALNLLGDGLRDALDPKLKK